MPPESIAKLRKSPQFKELIGYLGTELDKVDSLDGLAALSFTERAYEATSRLRAKEFLTGILAPLLETGDKPGGIDPKEYIA